ncbi:MAG: response regulator [Magnetovibrio sp.]|nr:response regulator [Magnetovibrio sp.]
MTNILVIDDDPLIRTLVEKYFSAKGCKVLVAEDGAHGIGLATRHPLDAVILDVEMPVLDGASTLHILRTTPEISSVPVVVISAKTDADTRFLMEDIGCTDFITKPLDMTHLYQVVDDSIKASKPMA